MKYRCIKVFYLFIVVSVITACGPITMEDSSHDPRFSRVIGRNYELMIDVLAIGITIDRNYKQNVDYINLKEYPGYAGPEVIFREKFPKGSTLRVTKVLTSASYLISRVVYVVKDTKSERYDKYELRIYVVDDVKTINYGLDTNTYQLIKE